MTTSNPRLEVVVNISDVLNLIPEYSGGPGEVEFIYFREACRNALAVLGPKNERLLMIFLKTKLKDDAYMRFALRTGWYDKLSKFLCDVKHIYAPKCDDPSFWNTKMFGMRQKSEATPRYGAKFQELLSCATIAAKHEQMLRAFLAMEESKEKQRRKDQAKKEEVKQESAKSETPKPKRRLNLDEVMELISASAPFDDEPNPKIETPISPEPRLRAEKTLSIMGADYPQLEYLKMPMVNPYKKYDKDLKYDYKKDEDDLKYELKPKTIVGKSS